MYERQDVVTECPICHTPINQNLRSWDRPKTSCGSDRCRQAISRENKRKRQAEEEAATRARVRQYCDTLQPENGDAILRIMAEHGYELAGEIIDILDSVRCKHDKIALIEEYAAAAKRRAEKAEEFNRQLETVYKQRIAELVAEVQLYQSLENAIHGVAGRQLEKQPEEA